MVRHQHLIVDGATTLNGTVTMKDVPELIRAYVDERVPKVDTEAVKAACDRLDKREAELSAVCDRLTKREAELTAACERVAKREALLAAKPPHVQ